MGGAARLVLQGRGSHVPTPRGGADMETNTNPDPGDNEAPDPEQRQPGQSGEETPQPSQPEKPDEELTPEAQAIGE
jgi:hypothetical protein